MSIILLNGPPRSGKDTAANFIIKNSERHFTEYKMSRPLKRGIATMWELTGEDQKFIEEHKDEELDIFNDTYRNVQISLSEDWFKPKFGIDIFGHLAVRAIQGMASHVVISDIGFPDEVRPLRKAFGDTLKLIRLHRPGCDFSNDSRSYLSDGLFHSHCVRDVKNYYDDLEVFELQIRKVLREWGFSLKEN
jgi:hypothetical protein